MLRIFLLLIIAQLSLSLPSFAAPQAQSLDEINEDLKAKKSDLEPFDPKKVKVDVESLGLDPVDDKKLFEKKSDDTNSSRTQLPSQGRPKAQDPTPKDPDSEPTSDAKPDNAKPTEASPESPGIVSKIKNIFSDDAKKVKEVIESKLPQALTTEPAPTVKNPKSTAKYINSKKKSDLKKRLELEKARAKIKAQKIENEKKQKEKLRKLNELRDQYLIKVDADAVAKHDLLEEDSKIIPQKKDLNRFLSDELPPTPILNRYRTADNRYIPLIPTIPENINLLFNSIVSNNLASFREAYKRIENPNIKNESGDTLLTCATLLRKHSFMSAILNQGANPNIPNDLGYTPLSIAIEMLDNIAVEILLKNNADVNYADNFGRTYLMHAARLGFLPAVSMLLDNGININAMDNDGFTALSIAYRHKQELIVQYLLKNGAKTWTEKPYEPEKQSLIKELENRWKN